MLGLRPNTLEDEVIPVKIAEVQVLVCPCLIRNHPRAGRILYDISTTVIHHLDLGISESPGPITLEIIIELITKVHIVIRSGHEIRRSRIVRDADTTCVCDLRIARTSALGIDKHHSGRSLRTIDCTGRCILKHGNRCYIVRIYLSQGTLYPIDQHKRCTRVQGHRSTDGYGELIALDGTAACGKHKGRIRSLKGLSRTVDRTHFKVLAFHNAYSTGEVDLLLDAVSDHNHLIEEVLIR